MSPLASIETALRRATLSIPSISEEDVRVPNVKFDPTGKDLWYELDCIPAANITDTLGARGDDLFTGAFIIYCNVPIDTGRGGADAILEALRGQFPAGASFSEGGTTVTIQASGADYPRRNEAHTTFYSYPFSVTWQSRVARPPIPTQ